ncbi:MAG: hypothetical protein DI538_19725 [Azospira oryzae]|jgi:hypothetical protein|nr:MAG: hypothetical protein DI538_19725 [Azospira oryzae]
MKKSLFESVKLKSWIALIVLIPILSSCLKSSDPVPVTPTSYASFYHGSPDTGGLDILLDGTKLNSTAFAYGNYSGYASFEVGANTFRFTPTGSTTGLKETTFNFENGKLYSIFIINNLANLETMMVRDTATALSSSGKAGIRLVHLSPDAPEINIYTTGSNAKLLFGSRQFKTATDFTEIDANVYTFDIKTSDGTKLATVENMSFASGRYYTLVVRGFVTPPSGNTNTITLQQLVNQ